jgi:glycosyltransferase involved in cell wall biosynthesis
MIGGSRPSVSVVVPTRDRPALLARTLAAVVAQDYTGDVECIVVHDGEPAVPISHAGTGRVRLRHIRNARTPGLPGARNTGILAAGGELIAFCDDDDVWSPTKLRKQVAVLDSDGSTLVVGSGNTVVFGTHRTVRIGSSDSVRFHDLLLSRVAVLHSSTILARRGAVIHLIGLMSEEIPGGASEDYEWQLRAARLAPIRLVNEPLVDIEWHDGSMYARRWDLYVGGLRYILDHYREFDDAPKGRARICGQIAFGYAMCRDMRDAMHWAARCLRDDLAQPRAYLAVLVTLRLLPANAMIHWLHRHGRGI